MEPVGQVLGPCMRLGAFFGFVVSASMLKRRQPSPKLREKNSHSASACMQSELQEILLFYFGVFESAPFL